MKSFVFALFFCLVGIIFAAEIDSPDGVSRRVTYATLFAPDQDEAALARRSSAGQSAMAIDRAALERLYPGYFTKNPFERSTVSIPVPVPAITKAYHTPSLFPTCSLALEQRLEQRSAPIPIPGAQQNKASAQQRYCVLIPRHLSMPGPLSLDDD